MEEASEGNPGSKTPETPTDVVGTPATKDGVGEENNGTPPDSIQGTEDEVDKKNGTLPDPMEDNVLAISLRGSPAKRKLEGQQPQGPQKKKAKSDAGLDTSSASDGLGSDEEYVGPKLPPSPEKRPTRMVSNRIAARTQLTQLLTQQSLDEHF